MVYIEKSTLETAKENMEKALAHYKAIEQDAPPLERQAAWNEYKERSSDYRSFLRCAYHL